MFSLDSCERIIIRIIFPPQKHTLDPLGSNVCPCVAKISSKTLLPDLSQVALVVKNLPANVEDMRRGFNPWIRKVPWWRAWQPTPVFLPGESPWTEVPGGL